MNPREFCREPGYTAAVLLTYDFNPLFFERIVLPELWSGGTGDVLVFADARRITETSVRWTDQLRHLGHRYQLVQAATRGAFHPKVIFRCGSEGGAVWLGSGNLTAGGWGGNQELAVAWRVGPEAEDKGAWVAGFLDRLRTWSPPGAEHDALGRLRENGWIERVAGEGPEAPSPVLMSVASASLARQLEDRWRGRRFDSVRLFTGSTDRAAAQLRWLNDAFGVRHATVVVEPDRADFAPEELGGLPLAVDVFSSPSSRPLHAKFYWLEGPDGGAAIMGSANCSAAGWLRPPDGGGNVEVVTVYDQVSRDAFAGLLGLFQADDMEPVPLSSNATPRGEAERSVDPPHRLSEITWERERGEIRLAFGRPLPAGARVELRISGRTTSCRSYTTECDLWTAAVEEPFETRRSVFAEVVIESASGTCVLHHWVNDLAELRHASRGRRMVEVLRELNRPRTAREQQQIIAELQRIGVALLSDPSAFPDPLAGPAHEDASKVRDETSAAPIDPEQLVLSLEEVSPTTPEHSVAPTTERVSLIGVMRALFDDVVEDTEHGEAEEPEQDPEKEGDDPPPVRSGARKTGSNTAAPSEKQRARLREQMRQYLERFRDEKFPESCTATQMVQAAAYPLTVAALGSRGGWVDADEAQVWVVQVFDVLFRARFPGPRYGLLEALAHRCRTPEQRESFRRVVGDGTLWLALLSSLSGLIWKGRNGEFEKALALRSIFRSAHLLASSDPGRMRALVARLEQKRLRASVLTAAREAARRLDDLESRLREKAGGLLEAQQSLEIVHRPGDLLWKDQVGWASAEEEAVANAGSLEVYLHFRSRKVKVKAAGFYVNVTRSAESDSDISAALYLLQAPSGAWLDGRAHANGMGGGSRKHSVGEARMRAEMEKARAPDRRTVG